MKVKLLLWFYRDQVTGPDKNSPDTQYHHKHLPQDTPVHITHVDWLSNLPYTLKYHDQDENHIIYPESKIHLMVELSSEVCWHRPYWSSWVVWSPYSCNAEET